MIQGRFASFVCFDQLYEEEHPLVISVVLQLLLSMGDVVLYDAIRVGYSLLQVSRSAIVHRYSLDST